MFGIVDVSGLVETVILDVVLTEGVLVVDVVAVVEVSGGTFVGKSKKNCICYANRKLIMSSYVW